LKENVLLDPQKDKHIKVWKGCLMAVKIRTW